MSLNKVGHMLAKSWLNPGEGWLNVGQSALSSHADYTNNKAVNGEIVL